MLALYLPHLPMGGIERVTVTLANYWVAHGRDVTLLLDSREGELIDAVSPDVPVEILGASRTLWALPPLVRWLRRNRPTLLHSALPHNSVVALIAGMLTGTRVTVAEHSLMRHKIQIAPDVAKIVPLMRRLYPRAEAVMAASSSVADDIAAVIGIARPSIRVVGNSLVPDGFDPQSLVRPADMPADGAPVFVAIGRLMPVKDFPTALRAFRHVLNRRPAHLMIFGNGPEHEKLIALAAELKLGENFRLHEVVQDPWPYIANASALVVSALSEGFGNTVVEAMACGTQIVSTRCGAPVHLLRDGDFGILADVGDAEGLGNAMLTALDHPKNPTLLKEAASPFTVSGIAAQYAEVLMPGGSA